MDGVGAGGECRGDHGVTAEVRLGGCRSTEGDRHVDGIDVQRPSVGLGVHTDGVDAEPVRGPGDANGDLTAIRRSAGG